MAIVYAASVPHSPLLIPSIGKENVRELSQTTNAFKIVSQELLNARPAALIIISPHAQVNHACLQLNIRPSYLLDYESYGDFSTRVSVQGAPHLADAIKRPFNTARTRLPLSVVSNERLDVGLTTTLPALLELFDTLPIVPISLAHLKPSQALAYGQLLRSTLLDSPERLAVITSANLSHRLSVDSPAGFSPRAKAFDDRTRQAVRHNDATRLSHVRSETIREVEVCGLEPLLLLMGMLQGSRYTVRELSYEAPFGIGLPVFVFDV